MLSDKIFRAGGPRWNPEVWQVVMDGLTEDERLKQGVTYRQLSDGIP